MTKLYITKKDIGKKIYKIEYSEFIKEYFTVMADSEEQAKEKMWDIKSGYRQEVEEAVPSETVNKDDCLHEGFKDYLDDIKVFEMDKVTDKDFDKELPDDWIYEGLFS